MHLGEMFKIGILLYRVLGKTCVWLDQNKLFLSDITTTTAFLAINVVIVVNLLTQKDRQKCIK